MSEIASSEDSKFKTFFLGQDDSGLLSLGRCLGEVAIIGGSSVSRLNLSPLWRRQLYMFCCCCCCFALFVFFLNVAIPKIILVSLWTYFPSLTKLLMDVFMLETLKFSKTLKSSRDDFNVLENFNVSSIKTANKSLGCRNLENI